MFSKANFNPVIIRDTVKNGILSIQELVERQSWESGFRNSQALMLILKRIPNNQRTPEDFKFLVELLCIAASCQFALGNFFIAKIDCLNHSHETFLDCTQAMWNEAGSMLISNLYAMKIVASIAVKESLSDICQEIKVYSDLINKHAKESSNDGVKHFFTTIIDFVSKNRNHLSEKFLAEFIVSLMDFIHAHGNKKMLLTTDIKLYVEFCDLSKYSSKMVDQLEIISKSTEDLSSISINDSKLRQLSTIFLNLSDDHRNFNDPLSNLLALKLALICQELVMDHTTADLDAIQQLQEKINAAKAHFPKTLSPTEEKIKLLELQFRELQSQLSKVKENGKFVFSIPAQIPAQPLIIPRATM